MSNPYLSGNFAPVSGEIDAPALRVSGQIPRDLDGSLLRIGPNPVAPDPARYHWFTGNGMVHGVRIRGGRAESYKRRFVRDDETVAAFHQPPVSGPRPKFELGGGTANTNIIAHAGKLWAIVEAGNLPVELDADLETVARSNFDGTLPSGFSAHPKRDPVTGELWAAVYSPFANAIQVVVVGADGRVRKVVDVPTPGSAMVHDCAISEKYFVLLDLPVVFTPAVIERGGSFPYQWNEDYGARVGLLPRDGGAEDVVWCDVNPCYVFHPMNAYDDADGRVVLDVMRHPKMFATDMLGPNEGAPTFERWIVDPKGGPVKEQRLDPRGQEFPRHDERLVGRPYRYGYSAMLGRGEGLTFGGLLKHDLRDGKSEVHHEGAARWFMEPVFVPGQAGAAEDEGYVMAYVYDASTDKSDVVILHAQDFAGEPLATIHLPTRVPFGFHGNWVASS
jgi:carotenoid cleavage dioxygenase